MKALCATIDEATARGKLEQRRASWLGRWFPLPLITSHSQTASSPAVRLERVWLPHYLISIDVRRGNEQRVAMALVGGHEPTVSLVEPASLAWAEEPPPETFPARIDPAQALEAAREALLRLLLARPGWGRQLALEAGGRVEPIQYPFWAYYFRRRGGMLDVRLLDAVSGSPAGPKAKVALLSALADAARA